jgi:hypothetical protein
VEIVVMTTKKCLVAFDLECPETPSRDFLAPVWEGDAPRLLGLESGKFWDYGRVVFVGQDITKNEVFAKLVEAGRNISDVDQTLAELESYLGMVKEHCIGDVMMIERSPSGTVGFALRKAKAKPGSSEFGSARR